ncbi:MAG: hypothetical protein QXE18_07345 [Thermoplasmata archaeon]
MRALALLSGGLDSSLAVRLIMDQGIEVIALKFTSPFCRCDSGGKCHAADLAKKLGIEILVVPKGEEYLEIVRNPRFGRGSGMNPCIDCRIFMLKKAKEIADRIDAKIIFTGEVVGQRPMSQRRETLRLIEREARLEGKILRPLSAKLLPPTEAESMGWVDREKFLAISGRGRRQQISLAKSIGLNDYPCPAGGCLLTSKEYSLRLSEFLRNAPEKFTTRDAILLSIGRHFRIRGDKLIIGRFKEENLRLRTLKTPRDWIIEPLGVPGPTALFESQDGASLKIAASFVARYSDSKGGETRIRCEKESKVELEVRPADERSIAEARVG